jgi:hypothetical protein
MNQEYVFFLKNMEALYKEHGEKFIIIKNQSVFGIYDLQEEAVEAAKNINEKGVYLVQQIFENEEKLRKHSVLIED